MSETIIKSHIQGIVPADLQYQFAETAKFKAFVKGEPQKGAISIALTEAMELWLKVNSNYSESLEKFNKYERGEIPLKDAITR